MLAVVTRAKALPYHSTSYKCYRLKELLLTFTLCLVYIYFKYTVLGNVPIFWKAECCCVYVFIPSKLWFTEETVQIETILNLKDSSFLKACRKLLECEPSQPFALVIQIAVKLLTPVIIQFCLCACSIDLPLQFLPCLSSRAFSAFTKTHPPPAAGYTSNLVLFCSSPWSPMVSIPAVSLSKPTDPQLS